MVVIEKDKAQPAAGNGHFISGVDCILSFLE
jgi:hypothetical protein